MIESPGNASSRSRNGPGPSPWQRRWFGVIFSHDTVAGKAFDVALLVVILVSIAAVMIESVESIERRWGNAINALEWVITFLFSLEFLARIACVQRPLRYVFSFFGMVDLVSVLPTYIGLFYGGADTFATIRALRLLRVFRILKLVRHVSEAQSLLQALRQTWPKITVFLMVVSCAIVILGTAMYLIEGGPESEFDSIPRGVYWAIVTLTTVGYGDIAPVTEAGQALAAFAMLLGYAIIIVPTGIFSAQIITIREARKSARSPCPRCHGTGHDEVAQFCQHCGAPLTS